jgi:hypothetical protein
MYYSGVLLFRGKRDFGMGYRGVGEAQKAKGMSGDVSEWLLS